MRKIDNKNLGVILMVSWILILLIQPIYTTIIDVSKGSDWFGVNINLDKIDGTGAPDILYSRTIHRPMSGTWNAWVQVGESKVCGGSGVGGYDPAKSGVIRMGWEYFLGAPCSVPDANYRVCASWLMEDGLGSQKFFGPICSSEQKGRDYETIDNPN